MCPCRAVTAVSQQHSAFGVPCRGEPSVRPFFVWCRVIRTRITQMARMDANNRLCHSEHSEESRGEKEKRFFASLWMTNVRTQMARMDANTRKWTKSEKRKVKSEKWKVKNEKWKMNTRCIFSCFQKVLKPCPSTFSYFQKVLKPSRWTFSTFRRFWNLAQVLFYAFGKFRHLAQVLFYAFATLRHFFGNIHYIYNVWKKSGSGKIFVIFASLFIHKKSLLTDKNLE